MKTHRPSQECIETMRISRLSFEKEQRQLELCQQLISHKSYHSQEQLRHDLKQHGFEAISQSTVSHAQAAGRHKVA